MVTEAFVGKVFLERGDTGSPTAFTRVCQVFGISGFGQTNALVDVTTFCSEGNREYISGLADGSEVTINCNFETDDAVLQAMIADVQAKTTRELRLVANDGVHTALTFLFFGVCLSWELGPSVDNKNTINFTFKISGNIVLIAG